MPDPVSALDRAGFEGFATIREAGLRGMITVRGDLRNAALKKVVTGIAGVDFPGIRGINRKGDQAIAWMSPDEVLVMVAHDRAGTAVATISAALAGQHHLVADVSDARAVFRIEGPGAREVLAKLTPADVGAIEPGQIVRSRAGQVAAAFWLADRDAFELVSFRSTARYVFGLLKTAAQPGGEVGYF